MNERVAISIANISSVIDNNCRMEINIDAQNDLKYLIDLEKSKEKIIDDIYIFRFNNLNLSTIFKTNKNDVENRLKEEIVKKIKSERRNTWGIKLGENNNVGFNLRDVSGSVYGVILVNYKDGLIKDNEIEEVFNLYKRMAISLLVTIAFCFVIGFSVTKNLSLTVETIQKNLNNLNNDATNYDLSGISDPTLRGIFRKTISISTKMVYDLNKIEELISSAEKE